MKQERLLFCFFLLMVVPPFAFATGNNPYLLVLGVAQDGGYPQAGCNKACCRKFYSGETTRKQATSLALIDPINKKSWLFECTPDFREQLHMLREHLHDSTHLPSGIFITHAHVGHYGGMMQLGKEVMGTKNIPVYVMPRMSDYLKTNGPWSQLVSQQNIELHYLTNLSRLKLSDDICIKPIQVPHRDEYSETVGFEIQYGSSKVLFIPDIDKWEKWDYLNKVDSSYHQYDSAAFHLCKLFSTYTHVLIDGTFFKNGELPGRNMNEIPHPFVEETMRLLATLSVEQKKKIYFIHFNHTNPLIQDKLPPDSGFSFAKEGMILD